jgi:hypothetical protein
VIALVRDLPVIQNRASLIICVSVWTFDISTFKMLGFHRRTRSLIPVKELGKYDKVPVQEEEELYVEEETESYDVVDGQDKSRGRQLMLVYFVFLAEA